MEAASSAMEVQSLNCWTTREIPLTLLGRTAHEWLPIASGNSEDCWPKVDHVNPSQSLRPWGWGPEQVVVATSGLQHTRLLCPSPSPRACSNSCPLSRWCHPTISSCLCLLLLPSIFPSIRVFPNDLVLHIKWPKYCSFSFSISTSDEYSGLISFRMDWLDFLAVQGTLKSLLQNHSSKASILRRSAFFMVRLSHWHMTTGKTIALTILTFVGKVMSLLFNTLSRLVIAFLPKSKHRLISWLQSPSTLILELKKIQSVNVFTFPHLFLPSEWYHLHIWGCWYSSGQSWFQPVIYPAWHFTWSTLHVS